MFQSTRAIKTIFYINIVSFILQFIIPQYMAYLSMYDMNDSTLFQPFQLITYQFLHGGFLHIIVNMFVLLSFGPFVENIYGETRLWIYYLLCGVAGAVLHSLMLNSGNIPMVGASASIWGIMVMYVMQYPNQKMYFMFIPVGIKGKYIISALFLFELFGAFNQDGIAHFGHIGGGILGAIIFLLHKYKILDKSYQSGRRSHK